MSQDADESRDRKHSDNVKVDARELDLRNRELDVRGQELKQNRFLSTLKIITTGVVITLIPTIINHQIQNQEIEIKRLEGEMGYLDKFSGNVVEEDDLVKRRNFVEYLSIIAHSEDSRSRWKTYLSKVDGLANEQKTVQNEIQEKEEKARNAQLQVMELKRKLDKVEQTPEKSDELGALQEKLGKASSTLRRIEQEIIVKEIERQNLIENSGLRSKGDATDSSEIVEKLKGIAGRSTIQNQARGNLFYNYYLDINGRTGALMLNSSYCGGGCEWSFKEVRNGVYTIRNQAKGTPYYSHYLDINGRTGALMLNPEYCGGGCEWRLSNIRDTIFTVQNQAQGNKYYNYFLDIDGRTGALMLNSEYCGGGCEWKIR